MNRRRLLSALVGIAGTAGCASRPVDSPDTEDSDSGPQERCQTRQFPSATPSEDNLTINYEVSGDTEIQSEIFDFGNVGDARVDLSGYRIAFEDRSAHEIEELALIPSAKLRIVTYGDPSIPSNRDTCLQYTYIENHRLETPLFKDQNTRIALITPDGSHLIEKSMDLSDRNF